MSTVSRGAGRDTRSLGFSSLGVVECLPGRARTADLVINSLRYSHIWRIHDVESQVFFLWSLSLEVPRPKRERTLLSKETHFFVRFRIRSTSCPIVLPVVGAAWFCVSGDVPVDEFLNGGVGGVCREGTWRGLRWI